MKDFAELTGNTYIGQQKTKQEIRDMTRGKPVRPADYQYGQKLSEWDATLTAGSELILAKWEPLSDRMIVRLLLADVKPSAITLTDPQPLIGGCRKAQVLKVGPGKRIPGEWWKIRSDEFCNDHHCDPIDCGCDYHWFPSHRQPMTVRPGNVVLIGNWVDLEVKDIVLCQEGDVRGVLS